ncbi:MAG: flavin reductase family protein [Gammaproteobacteria bacterium]|nr:flavin reductase family protein [Gammaproteobacteria bacterium]
MPPSRHFYRPEDGHGLAHDPFNSIIAPRPIGWVSTKSASGQVNLAPYSFFNAFNYQPPIIGFSSIGYKDSVNNAQESGEFCWNLVTRSLVEAMNETSAMVSSDIDEFELAGLNKRESTIVAAPHVADCPVVMECKTTQIVQLQSARGDKCETWLVLGEVVGVHIAKALIEDGVYRTARAEPVMRGGGPADYFGISEANRFQIARPK